MTIILQQWLQRFLRFQPIPILPAIIAIKSESVLEKIGNMFSLTAYVMDGAVVFSPRRLSSSNSRPPTTFRWGFKRKQDTRLHPRRSQAILVLANPNVSPDKGNSKKEVVMVDPLEAKRLASQQMAQIKAKEKLRKQRQIEAINGAWAMIGLTAGLVIEGGTGKSIIAQLAGYWAAFIGFFVR